MCQPLSPGDATGTSILFRKTLIEKILPFLSGQLDEKVVFILGDEGNGKSWFVAQSWLSLPNKPLMVIINPDEFAETVGQFDVVNFIISKIIQQTENLADQITQERWRRRLRKIRRQQSGFPRLLVFIDGINQKPKNDWARIIEKFGMEVGQLGGRLIVSTRTHFFKDQVNNRLSVPFSEIRIPEWEESERDEILGQRGISPKDLHTAVSRSLRNPRLLGIALSLLSKANITSLQELTVSRLLFEHMRMSERDAPFPQPAQEFAKRLTKHAQEILDRLRAEKRDDLLVFDAEICAVADGRFFQAVDGEPNLYSLRDEGLRLALGFSVIDFLRKAERNNRNLDSELGAILEPIAALDSTPAVILAALTVTIAEDRTEDRITVALVKAFAGLQNTDEKDFPAFVGMVKTRPNCFLEAAQGLTLAGGNQRNYDWVKFALILAGTKSETWEKMKEQVHTWLSVRSLSPRRRLLAPVGRDSKEKVQEELEKNRKKIEEKLQALSSKEKEILDTLSETEGDLSRLSRLAFSLLAGKSLAPFANSLLNWRFSNALNSDHRAPYSEFQHLLSFNVVDWEKARLSLLEALSPLWEVNVSPTGKWVLVNVLYAMGNADDGKQSQELAKELTKDRPQFKGWRLLEDYCAEDPCDPNSKKPENISKTSEQYSKIDIAQLRTGMSMGTEDHFFEMARPGMVRFEKFVTVEKHREFAANVICRTGFRLRQGLLELPEHNSIFSQNEAQELIKKQVADNFADQNDGLSEQDKWLISQYRLLLAFPFLDARAQAEALCSNEYKEKLLLSLFESAKPLNEKDFEILLEKACTENNELNQYILLGLAKFTAVKLSIKTRAFIGELLESQSRRVRTEAMGLIAISGDEVLLRKIAQSDWKVERAESEDDFEAWYGSAAVLEAAKLGLLPHSEAIVRISPRLFGQAATTLDAETVRNIAFRLNEAIYRVVGLNSDLYGPDMVLQLNPAAPYEPSRFFVGDQQSNSKDDLEEMKRLTESREAFEQRQKCNIGAFLEFKAKLTTEKAYLVLDRFDLKEFATVVAAAKELANRWYELFMKIPDEKIPIVHNLAFFLGHALVPTDPEKSAELFLRFGKSKPLVRFTVSLAAIPLDSIAIWTGDSNSIIDQLRLARLDAVGNDFDLSIEVLAALVSEKEDLLFDYVKRKLEKDEPSEIARGIMVAGFSDACEFNENTLARFEGMNGLTGRAQKAAKYAYERNLWSRYWFEKMCQTEDNVDYWRFSVLFSKIVDGRFVFWEKTFSNRGKPFLTFGHLLEDQLKNRFKCWENHRSKKLFGEDAPAGIFLGKGLNND
ncbi:MAG: hypothetical protein WA705_20900 [Candidatus Ozemobacteraceae bacterium]